VARRLGYSVWPRRRAQRLAKGRRTGPCLEKLGPHYAADHCGTTGPEEKATGPFCPTSLRVDIAKARCFTPLERLATLSRIGATGISQRNEYQRKFERTVLIPIEVRHGFSRQRVGKFHTALASAHSPGSSQTRSSHTDSNGRKFSLGPKHWTTELRRGSAPLCRRCRWKGFPAISLKE